MRILEVNSDENKNNYKTIGFHMFSWIFRVLTKSELPKQEKNYNDFLALTHLYISRTKKLETLYEPFYRFLQPNWSTTLVPHMLLA